MFFIGKALKCYKSLAAACYVRLKFVSLKLSLALGCYPERTGPCSELVREVLNYVFLTPFRVERLD
jgi:hypothetical protein